MASEYRHDTLGIIRLQRRVGCKRISISVGHGGSVRVSHPWYVSRRAALAFVEQKAEWIQATQNRTRQMNHPTPLTEGYKTRSHTLHILTGAARNGYTIDDTAVVVHLQIGVDINSELGQEVIRTAVIETLRTEAHEILPQLVERLAAEHGFRHNGLTIKNIHSKWGSCSATNHLNFSLYLMLLPSELVEFVVLHELCHTVHKNHSAKFHTLLNTLLNGREHELNLQLRKHRTTL